MLHILCASRSHLYIYISMNNYYLSLFLLLNSTLFNPRPTHVIIHACIYMYIIYMHIFRYICDFGMSLYLPEDQSKGIGSTFGPVCWMAPEALLTGEFSVSTDIYM